MQIGWSMVDITPPKAVRLRGQFHERISTHVRDPLTATVLVMEDGRDQLVMVSCDLCAVDRQLQERVRDVIRPLVPDLQVEKLFLNAIHTHTGPFLTELDQFRRNILLPIGDGPLPLPLPPSAATEDKVMPESAYTEFLIGLLGDAVARAWKNRRPGGVSWALSHAVVGHNRRVVYDDGTARMYGRTDTEHFETVEGPSDHGVELLYCWDAQQKLTGVVVNVACPSQVVENKCYISADFWDEARKELRKQHGNDLGILALCSAAGDQSPRDLPRRGRGEPNMHDEGGLVEIGQRIAEAVGKKIATARTTIVTDAVLRHSVSDVQLPLRQVSDAEVTQAQAEFDAILADWKSQQKPASADLLYRLFAPAGILRRSVAQQQSTVCPCELHAVRIGDVVIATNPFELFLDYGLQMKARSPAQQTFLIQLACDCSGYLPTARAVRGGHYSAIVASGNVGPAGGKLLVEQTVEMINALWK